MHSRSDTHSEAALYWTAVSLIVCEGLSIEQAAERLDVDEEKLRTIVHRRQTLRPFADEWKVNAQVRRIFEH